MTNAAALSSSTGRISIFRTGDFVSVEGKAVSFGQAELEQIASSYDAASDPAPLVIGHPKIEDPAYGWVGGLSVEDGVLIADPDRVEPSFAETVRAGRYAKVSAQLYPPEHGSNPKPGSWYLKHVGFLGAAAPAVKGLGTVSLSDGDADGLVCVEFSAAEFLGEFSQQKEVPMSETPKGQAGPKEPNGELASFAEREADLAKRENEIAAREAQLEQQAREAALADAVSFAEELVSEGKLAPAGKDLLIGVMDQLSSAPNSSRVVSFAEAGKMTPAAALRKLFEGARPLVSFSELAKPDGAKLKNDDPADIAQRAASFAEEHNVNIAQAVRQVTKEGQ